MKVRIEIECPYCNKTHVHILENLQWVLEESASADDSKPIEENLEDVLEEEKN